MIVNRDFFAGLDIAQGDEEHVSIENFHERVWLAGMIDVVSAVAAAAAVQTPALVDGVDSQTASVGPPVRFGIADSLARILRDFATTGEMSNREAALPLYRRILYR